MDPRTEVLVGWERTALGRSGVHQRRLEHLGAVSSGRPEDAGCGRRSFAIHWLHDPPSSGPVFHLSSGQGGLGDLQVPSRSCYLSFRQDG